MTEAANQIDRKTLDRVKKLLNLAKDGGATEGEAASAMEKARQIMADNNLTMAQLEASGQDAGEGSKRLKSGLKGKALYKYQQALMQTIADTNFTAVMVDSVYRNGRYMDTGYTLIGREANVAAVLNMFEYLNASLERIVTPHLASNSQRLSRWAVSFKEGAAQRLRERLRERHEAELKAQSDKARASQAAQPASSGTSAGNAMVVVMEDFAQAERDANEDLRMNRPAGMTAQLRAENEARAAEYRRREEERRASLTEEERAAEDAKREKDQAKWEKKWQRRSDNFWKNKDMDGYWAGREAADQIGLDDQIDHQNTPKLK